MKTSSIVTEAVIRPRKDQLSVPTWGIIVVLIIAMVALKTFIYIKDPKRDGK